MDYPDSLMELEKNVGCPRKSLVEDLPVFQPSTSLQLSYHLGSYLILVI